jgi:hypothetical protein
LKLINAIAKEVDDLKDQNDMISFAVTIMATGQVQDSKNSESQYYPKGAYEKLVKLLGSQSVHHKLNYFDPDLLNRMAHKVANLDALLQKNPAILRAGPDLGLKELDSQIRKMGKEMRIIKERLSEALASAGTGTASGLIPSGDHAMLAGKPAVLGYRCLACDRPLDKLDPNPGTFMPPGQLPTKTQTSVPQEKQSISGRKGALSPEPSANNLKRAAYDPAQRGPQQWYEENGKPAEYLPKDDVGPKLAPGGWTRRTSTSGMRISINGSKTGLPDILPPAPWSPSTKDQQDGGSTFMTLPAI